MYSYVNFIRNFKRYAHINRSKIWPTLNGIQENCNKKFRRNTFSKVCTSLKITLQSPPHCCCTNGTYYERQYCCTSRNRSPENNAGNSVSSWNAIFCAFYVAIWNKIRFALKTLTVFDVTFNWNLISFWKISFIIFLRETIYWWPGSECFVLLDLLISI